MHISVRLSLVQTQACIVRGPDGASPVRGVVTPLSSHLARLRCGAIILRGMRANQQDRVPEWIRESSLL